MGDLPTWVRRALSSLTELFSHDDAEGRDTSAPDEADCSIGRSPEPQPTSRTPCNHEIVPPWAASIPKVSKGDVAAYARLVRRQVDASKVRLSTQAVSGAGVFAVGKSGKRLREVWNGSRLSQCARRPPPPPHLASPARMGAIEVAPGHKVLSAREMRRSISTNSGSLLSYSPSSAGLRSLPVISPYMGDSRSLNYATLSASM